MVIPRAVRRVTTTVTLLLMQAVPLYLSEMAPPQLRGGLNIMFQMATTIGVLTSPASWHTMPAVRAAGQSLDYRRPSPGQPCLINKNICC